MSWAEFWAPNLVQWIVGGGLTAAAGLAVRFLLPRWFDRTIKPWLEAWLKSAIGASNEAAKESRETRKTVLALTTADGRFATVLPEEDDQVEYLRDQNSRLVAQLVIQAAKHPEDFDSPTAPRPTVPPGLLIPAGAGEADDPITTTGRHRLHTQRFPTVDERDDR